MSSSSDVEAALDLTCGLGAGMMAHAESNGRGTLEDVGLKNATKDSHVLNTVLPASTVFDMLLDRRMDITARGQNHHYTLLPSQMMLVPQPNGLAVYDVFL